MIGKTTNHMMVFPEPAARQEAVKCAVFREKNNTRFPCIQKREGFNNQSLKGPLWENHIVVPS
jgi:hypothetical protein